MFIAEGRSGYTASGQWGSGWFLHVFDYPLAYNKDATPEERRELRCVVRKVRLSQLGHFMMGEDTVCGQKYILSGAYGNDGLPDDLCLYPLQPKTPEEEQEILGRWGRLHPLPQSLIDAFWAGGGHNCAGSEGPLLREWANENREMLRRTLRKPPISWYIEYWTPRPEQSLMGDIRRAASSRWKTERLARNYAATVVENYKLSGVEVDWRLVPSDRPHEIEEGAPGVVALKGT